MRALVFAEVSACLFFGGVFEMCLRLNPRVLEMCAFDLLLCLNMRVCFRACVYACMLCEERTLNPKAMKMGGQGWVLDTSRRARGFRRGPVKQDREGPSVPKRLSLEHPKP